MTLPNCTNWRGHKFEARYSKTASEGWPKFKTGSLASAQQVFDATRDITYERDICIRCGAVVEKVKP